MQSDRDWQLLDQFIRSGSQPAFAELVARHVDMVYSAALRQVHDRHLAEEVTQAVFLLLAQKARRLPASVMLSGWLHNAARYTALNALKMAAVRQKHERRAAEMAEQMRRVDSSWHRLEPLLDDAVARLNDRDRAAIVMRFFQQKSMSEVGSALGISENAAQMRVSRSLDKLRQYFARQGVALPAMALGGVLLTNSASPAPPHLPASIVSYCATSTGQTIGALADTVGRSLFRAKMKTVAIKAVSAAVFAVIAYVAIDYLLMDPQSFLAPTVQSTAQAHD